MKKFLRFIAVLSICSVFFMGCGKGSNKVAVLYSEFDQEWSNTFKLSWPSNITNVAIAEETYNTPFEGSRSRILILKIETDADGKTNLLRELLKQNIPVVDHIPITNQRTKDYAKWWNPESFGPSQSFKTSVPVPRGSKVLTGHIPNNVTNGAVFIQLHIVQR